MRSRRLPRFSSRTHLRKGRDRTTQSLEVSQVLFRSVVEIRIREKNPYLARPTQPKAHHTGKPRPVKELKSLAIPAISLRAFFFRWSC